MVFMRASPFFWKILLSFLSFEIILQLKEEHCKQTANLSTERPKMAHNAGVCAVAKGHQNPVAIAYTQNYAPFLFVNLPVKNFQLKEKINALSFNTNGMQEASILSQVFK